jgi:hypothetical protein
MNVKPRMVDLHTDGCQEACGAVGQRRNKNILTNLFFYVGTMLENKRSAFMLPRYYTDEEESESDDVTDLETLWCDVMARMDIVPEVVAPEVVAPVGRPVCRIVSTFLLFIGLCSLLFPPSSATDALVCLSPY